MTLLQQSLDEIKVLLPLAKEEVLQDPVQTLIGRQGRKNRAVERLAQLRIEYSDEMLRSAVFMVVVGSKRAEFAATAIEQFKCFAIEGSEFYDLLASKVPAAVYASKESLFNIFDIMTRHLEDLCMRLGITSYPQIIFRESYARAIKTQEDLTAVFQQAVNEQVGAEIVGIYASRTLVDQAIARNHAGKTTPIIITASSDQLALELVRDLPRVSSNVYLVAAGKVSATIKKANDVVSVKEATPEDVEKVIKGIKGSKK